MNKKLLYLLSFTLIIHLSISIIFILKPSIFSTKFSEIYNVYLLPGPFFRAEKVTHSYILCMSWKLGGEWTHPVSPVIDNFRAYNKSFNSTDLYRNRFERSLYQGVFLKGGLSPTDFKASKGFQDLSAYFINRYAPPATDSVRLFVVTKRTKAFRIQSDTVGVALKR
jgi:hypothetical protein